MADQYLFDNEDSEDERADAEEMDTLAARDTWVGIANSTQDQFKVETFLERVREKSVGGETGKYFLNFLNLTLEMETLSHIPTWHLRWGKDFLISNVTLFLKEEHPVEFQDFQNALASRF